MERRKYLKPPIEEAVCEFHFAPGPEWNLTVPGLFYDKIKGGYSGKPRQQNVIEAGFPLKVRPEGAPFMFKQALAKVQFPTEDGKKLVAVGHDVLSIHVLRPYTGWEDFRSRIEQTLQTYVEVAKPVGIRRIGLRYINHVVLPVEGGFDLADYFRAYPMSPVDLPASIEDFLSRIVYEYDDEPIKLALSFATIETVEKKPGFLLDFDLISEMDDKPFPLEDAMKRVDELRARERIAFEAVITDKTREVFDAV